MFPSLRHVVFDSQSLEDFVLVQAAKFCEKNRFIWPNGHDASLVQLALSRLDRIGGQEGYSGSQVFVANLVGRQKSSDMSVRSYPLLLKVAHGKRLADKLFSEKTRYESIAALLAPRYHARVLDAVYDDAENDEKCILWSEFIDESGIRNLPNKAPTTLRGELSQQKWHSVDKSLEVLYDTILWRLHNEGSSFVNGFTYFTEYSNYRKEGWLEQLETALDSRRKLSVLNSEIPNPTILYRQLEQNDPSVTGRAHISGIHGDLHPNNVLVSESQPSVLIDFGLTQKSFHTIADFVVMEASIKFFGLHWCASRVELRYLEDAFTEEFLPDLNVNRPDLARMCATLQLIRRKALRYIDPSDFQRQYLLPLYCTTMGLFKYAAQVNNLAYLILSSGKLAHAITRFLGL